jgi:hypothetical protein
MCFIFTLVCVKPTCRLSQLYKITLSSDAGKLLKIILILLLAYHAVFLSPPTAHAFEGLNFGLGLYRN